MHFEIDWTTWGLGITFGVNPPEFEVTVIVGPVQILLGRFFV